MHTMEFTIVVVIDLARAASVLDEILLASDRFPKHNSGGLARLIGDVNRSNPSMGNDIGGVL